MYTYKVEFYVNGRRTEQIIRANSYNDARKLIEAQYANCKVSFASIRLV